MSDYSNFQTPRVFNTNTNHPLIQNSQEYIFYKKYLSIHSQDRNILKYPSSSEFEIEMPEDLLNVVSLRLINCAIPSIYSIFSLLNENTEMTFKINNPYNPNDHGISDVLSLKIYEFLSLNVDTNFYILIETGTYTSSQMVTELTNKFNNAVTLQIFSYFTSQSTNPSLTPAQQAEYLAAITLLNSSGGYKNFIIVYNDVSKKIWFGNVCDGFILTNQTQILKEVSVSSFNCANKNAVPDFSDWGLPGNLGLSRCDTPSVNGATISGSTLTDFPELALYNGSIVPRFYYGDVKLGDHGFWLVPNPALPGSVVNWVKADYKANLTGPLYFYMEIAGQNCIDETQPYNVSDYTIKTNSTKL